MSSDVGSVTRAIAELGSSICFDDLPPTVVQRAQHCLLDWLGGAIAGASEPAVTVVRELALAEGGHAQATLLASGESVTASQAALVNGVAGHALEFDDVSKGLGHPSAPIVPAALALGQRDNCSGRALIAAYVAGHEVHARVGYALTTRHYELGWHTTATVGTFGAAAACSHLLGLDTDQWQTALGIAATQAAGLKVMFGTMTKTLQVGRAAQNGMLAAHLTARGFTGALDAIEADQGFAVTHTTEFAPQQALQTVRPGEYALQRILFKRHAACFGTHSMIEGLASLQRTGLHADEIDSVTLRVPPGHLSVCNIADPTDATEAKFSLRHVCAMVISGRSTGVDGFADDTVHDPLLAGLRRKVTVEATPGEPQRLGATEVIVRLTNGTDRRAVVDVTTPTPDDLLDEERISLKAKFRSLAGPILGAPRANDVIDQIGRLDELESIRPLLELTIPTQSASRFWTEQRVRP